MKKHEFIEQLQKIIPDNAKFCSVEVGLYVSTDDDRKQIRTALHELQNNRDLIGHAAVEIIEDLQVSSITFRVKA